VYQAGSNVVWYAVKRWLADVLPEDFLELGKERRAATGIPGQCSGETA